MHADGQFDFAILCSADRWWCWCVPLMVYLHKVSMRSTTSHKYRCDTIRVNVSFRKATGLYHFQWRLNTCSGYLVRILGFTLFIIFLLELRSNKKMRKCSITRDCFIITILSQNSCIPLVVNELGTILQLYSRRPSDSMASSFP